MTKTTPRIALLGLGTMGAGMAQNLLKAGYPLTVYNRNPARAAALADAGAQVAATPRAAASDADIIISMVADDAASRAVWMDENGAFAGVPLGALVIESSTLSVGWVNQWAAEARTRKCEPIDAPVTGSKPQAAAGELRFLVGGEEHALERARPILTAMGTAIVHVGPTGSGALLKLINNFLCAVQAVSLAEAMTLIERSSLDRGTALDVLLNGAPGSPMLKVVTSRINAGDFEPNFFMRLMAKDLTYARHEGQLRGVSLDTAGTALQTFERAIAEGYGDRDLSAVVESLRRS
jgi:3-hydroxyisobutyrate dehydrogenase